MSRALAAFTRERLQIEITSMTIRASRAQPGSPTSDERLRAVAHLETQLRIVELVEPVADDYGVGWTEGLLAAVRLIAAVYRDHPDYREEWAP